MRRKKSIPIPVPDPEKQGLEYVCPSASWGDMTGLIPTGRSGDKSDEVCKDIYPCRPEYEGGDNAT
jgi:hypothetical protein